MVSARPVPSTIEDDVVWARVGEDTVTRSGALNAGFRASSGDVVAFLHADTHLPESYDAVMLQTLRRVPVGCFQLRFDHASSWLRIVEWVANNVRGIPYGDQCYFVDRAHHMRVGLFAEVPMMEDVDYIVRRCAKRDWTVVRGAAATTSAVRYLRDDGSATFWSVFGNVLKNNVIVFAVTTGMISIEDCAEWYYRKSSRNK